MILDPRERFDLVKDPVHGYIRFTKKRLNDDEKVEADLINHPWLQRLRRIRQLQAAWTVYPAADHTRFSHALGTMHLAGRFARSLYEPYYNSKVSQDPAFKELLPDIESVVETFRIAGLLHDVGHGPFTHLLDDKYLYPKYEITHEDISAKIVINELGDLIRGIRRSPEGKLMGQLDPELIAKLIKKGGEKDLQFPWRGLHQILRGAYDADKMDFILRDSLLCGQQGINAFDVDRLIGTSFVYDNQLALHNSSLPLLQNFLLHRIYLFEHVYYHRTVRAFERQVGEVIAETLDRLLPYHPLESLSEYKELNEFYFLSFCQKMKKSSNPEERVLGEKWEMLLNSRPKWKQVFLHAVTSVEGPIVTAKNIEDNIKNDLKEKDIPFIIDKPEIECPENIWRAMEDGADAIVIYNPLKPGKIDTFGLRSLMNRIPAKVTAWRVYVAEECSEEQRLEIQKLAQKYICGTRTDQLSSY